jgi:hypothetical protein
MWCPCFLAPPKQPHAPEAMSISHRPSSLGHFSRVAASPARLLAAYPKPAKALRLSHRHGRSHQPDKCHPNIVTYRVCRFSHTQQTAVPARAYKSWLR